MFSTIRSHVRGNVIGYLALFVALSGTAYAAMAPKNSVTSKSIKNGQVRTADLGSDAVTGPKVANGSLAGADLEAGSVSGAQVKDDSLSGADLVNGSINGADVGDGSLSKADLASGQFGSAPAAATYASHDPVDFQIPVAIPTQVIFTGDQANGDSGGALIHLSQPGRVLATASLQLINADVNLHTAFCRFGIAPAGNPSPTPFGQEARQAIPGGQYEQLSIAAGTGKPAGDYYVNVGCFADSAMGSNIKFDKGDLIVWALPAQ
ncbi:MAG: hypothetical protein ABIZ50_06665 [Solirubrobacterales bacterium]